MGQHTHTITITGPHASARVINLAHLGAQLAVIERTLTVQDATRTDLTARQAIGICVFGVLVDPYGLNIHGEAIIPPGLTHDHPRITQTCEPDYNDDNYDYTNPCTHDAGLNRFSVHAPSTTEVIIDTQYITGDPEPTPNPEWLAALNYLYPDLRITVSEYASGGFAVDHTVIPYEQFGDYASSDDARDQLCGPGMVWRSEYTSLASWQTTSYTNIDLPSTQGKLLAASGATGYVTDDRYHAVDEQLLSLRAQVPVVTATNNAHFLTALPNTPQREHHDYCD